MTVTTCKTSLFSTDDISILVKTNNQGIKKQPCLWLVHGSGGISSNEDLWIEHAFAEGFCVIIVDSYSNRGIYKQNWESLDEYRIDPKYCIFIEDIARNLKPANELGMKTAWIKNNEPWAAEFSNESFIDYKINNLSEFLRRINEQK